MIEAHLPLEGRTVRVRVDSQADVVGRAEAIEEFPAFRRFLAAAGGRHGKTLTDRSLAVAQYASLLGESHFAGSPALSSRAIPSISA